LFSYNPHWKARSTKWSIFEHTSQVLILKLLQATHCLQYTYLLECGWDELASTAEGGEHWNLRLQLTCTEKNIKYYSQPLYLLLFMSFFYQQEIEDLEYLYTQTDLMYTNCILILSNALLLRSLHSEENGITNKAKV